MVEALHRTTSLLREAGNQWLQHKAGRLGAALAYYSLFSLAPLLVIVIAVAGLMFGQDAVSGRVTSELQGLLGETGANFIAAMVASASRVESGLVAATIDIVVYYSAQIVLFGAEFTRAYACRYGSRARSARAAAPGGRS